MEDSREIEADNDGEKQEKGKDDLSQQIASETESTISSPKAGEDDTSVKCIPDTKSKKRKKRKKKKAETANIAPVNEGEASADHEPLTSTVNIDQAKLDSAKDCSEAHDPMTSITASKKKKKKKKKKKTGSMVCEGEMETGDSLKEQPDKQEILDGSPNFEGASNSGNTEEDQEDLAVMKNEKQEIDADTQSQKGGGDAESIEGENENWSEDAPEDTALVGEEVEISPVPVSEEEDSSCTPKAVPEKVNAAQSGSSIYKVVTTGAEDLVIMEDSRKPEAKNTELRPDNDGEKQEKGKDDLSQQLNSITQQITSETESTISSQKAGEDDKSMECISDCKSKKKKKQKKKKAETTNVAPVNEGEVSTDHEPLPSTVNIDQAKLDSAKDCSEAHDPMTSITHASKKKKKKKKKTESMVCEGEMKTGDSLKEQPDKQEILDGTPNFEGASNSGNTEEDQEDVAVMKNEKQEIDADTQSQKGGGDAESIEGENENWSEDAPEDTALVGEEVETSPAPVSEEEDSSCNPKAVPEKVNAAQSGGSIYKAKLDSAKDCSKAHDPMTSITASKKKKKKKKKTESMVCEGEMKTGDSLKEQLDKQEILDSTPMEGASNSGNTEEDQEDLAVMENEKQEIDADTRSQKGGGDAESIEGEDENWSEDPPEDTALVGEEVETPPVSEEEDSSCTPKAVPEKVNTELATTSDEAKESNEDRWYPDILEEEVETDASEDISSDEPDNEGRNILCIFKLVYGVGLRALRKLFLEINPTWSNQPSDAAGFDKGKMKLSKEEEAIFNNGNVKEWDFSLMTTVLLYSKICALEISKKPGYDIALQKLKKCRNKLLGHPSSDGMSDDDFNKTFWPLLSTHFVTLGADPDDIAAIKLQSDEDLHAGGHYKQLFLTEKANAIHYGKKLDSIESKLDTIIANQTPDAPNKTPISPKDLSGRNWDEWLKFCDAVGDFDTQKNQYILVADALPPEILDCFSNLRSVPWKMVLDFDPMSEEKGFYRSFTSEEGQGSLVSMITPAEVKGSTMVSLARQIDPNKIQWLFVNGRSSDTDGNIPTFPDWEATSVKEISRFFGCCCDPDKFDKQKPVVCLILPFCQESVPYLEVTLSRLFENFDDQFNLKTVSFKQEKHLPVLRKVKVRTVDLSPQLVHLGLKEMLSFSSTQQYRMPTSQAKVYAELSEKEYLYLKEHLEILYEGCESLPEISGDPSEEDVKLQNFLNEHRKLFMSGNQISFASLYDNHDANGNREGHSDPCPTPSRQWTDTLNDGGN
ncbi:hypothetical protein OS493_016045 [Desmophyllum pertusum]|uniref:Uncharacterized protein n=1 Tax=Desmophyllum pertusum TaxID=174260 RepID=A0A9X0A1J3_9CNID|nr:hypothetical protein OS493_016045 [Desmophyllum pertusum]